MGNQNHSKPYVLRDKYDCKSWNELPALLSPNGWVLSEVTQPGGGDGSYLRKGDDLIVENVDGVWRLRVMRDGTHVRTMAPVVLQGLENAANLWAKTDDAGYCVYLYLLDGTTSHDGKPKRRIHVDVFYPDSQYKSEKPGPDTVKVL